MAIHNDGERTRHKAVTDPPTLPSEETFPFQHLIQKDPTGSIISLLKVKFQNKTLLLRPSTSSLAINAASKICIDPMKSNRVEEMVFPIISPILLSNTTLITKVMGLKSLTLSDRSLLRYKGDESRINALTDDHIPGTI